ncbi:putative esterase [Sphingomonas metalli]|uniref:Esterase n=1 Tax=Sphingomonas metalli TaxID=1779358 RepID=A0A916TF13_9SPHN|nr:tannase/feruloyl esterase family alpha/beta hydrolase [Sphingomonas metalli]GGB42869.1 putative esterase [Sphingomonas metalli]
MSSARLILAAALLAGPAGAATQPCAALSASGGSVQARPIAAVGTTPAFCRVTGTLRPVAGSRIGFELLLPAAASWTGRFQMLGNGGYSSALPRAAMMAALGRGSAVVATDTGHDGDDPSFARGRPEAIVDWGWRAVHLTARAAQRLAARYYGRPPSHRYFAGCSTGGHQAMMEAQRFPDDFDGIVAGAPGADRTRLNAAFLWQYLSNHPRGRNDTAILDSGDLQLLARHSYASCRSTNGGLGGGLADDPWLNDPLSCRPDPAALLCRPGASGDCLSPTKVEAAQAMYQGVHDPRSGASLTYAWLPGSETGWSGYWADPGNAQQPARINFWRDWVFRTPEWTWWSLNPARDLAVAQRRLSATVDAVSPDLSRFRAHGGRLLVYHGLADPVVSPRDTVAKFRHARSVTGGDEWARLFLAPGVGHCAGGPGFDRFDPQAAMEAWVERAVVPEHLVAADAAGRTRPLCPYPRRAVFRGGDPRRADSFTCSAPPTS